MRRWRGRYACCSRIGIIVERLRAHHCQADPPRIQGTTPAGERSVGGMAPGGGSSGLGGPFGNQSSVSIGQCPSGQPRRVQHRGEPVSVGREDQLFLSNRLCALPPEEAAPSPSTPRRLKGPRIHALQGAHGVFAHRKPRRPFRFVGRRLLRYHHKAWKEETGRATPCVPLHRRAPPTLCRSGSAACSGSWRAATRRSASEPSRRAVRWRWWAGSGLQPPSGRCTSPTIAGLLPGRYCRCRSTSLPGLKAGKAVTS